MAKKESLPELIVSTGDIVLKAQDALLARSKASEAVAEEDHAKDRVKTEAVVLRINETDKSNYIGLIRIITGQDVPSVRVEFRINNGALDVGEEAKLDTLFGVSKPELFERAKVITEITAPDALVKDLKAWGLNPWDYLELRVKDEAGLIAQQQNGNLLCCFNTAEAILPKKGFLTRLNEIATTLSKGAKDYINVYLDNVLKPTVVLGTKTEAK